MNSGTNAVWDDMIYDMDSDAGTFTVESTYQLTREQKQLILHWLTYDMGNFYHKKLSNTHREFINKIFVKNGYTHDDKPKLSIIRNKWIKYLN